MSYVGRVLSVGKTHDVAIVPAAVTCPVMFLACLLWLVSLLLLTTLHFLVSFLLSFVRDPDISAVAVSLQFLTVAGFCTVACTHIVACVSSDIACL
jgi:hypothetical protein